MHIYIEKYMAKVIRLRESELVGLINKIISEQSTDNMRCLLDAGFKPTQIGGPATKRIVYSNIVNGKTHQYSLNGTVRIFDKNMNKVGKWRCDSTSPNGVLVYDLKDSIKTPM